MKSPMTVSILTQPPYMAKIKKWWNKKPSMRRIRLSWIGLNSNILIKIVAKRWNKMSYNKLKTIARSWGVWSTNTKSGSMRRKSMLLRTSTSWTTTSKFWRSCTKLIGSINFSTRCALKWCWSSLRNWKISALSSTKTTLTQTRS